MTAFIHRETIGDRAKTVTLKATPFERKQLAPTTHRLHRFDYLIGEMQPNYPMPVTASVAATMLFADQGEFDLAARWQLETLTL